MNNKLSEILTGILFAGLILGTSSIQTELKSILQIYCILFGSITFVSLIVKQPFSTSTLFYILLGTMLYLNISMLTNLFVNLINPLDGWVVGLEGERNKVMQTNWIWGVLAGMVLSPVAVVLYHKKVKKNKVLEISLTTIFTILTAIIYFKNEIL